MSFNLSQKPIEQRRFIYSLFVPVLLLELMIAILLIGDLNDFNLSKFGIRPRVVESWWGIFTSPLIHGSWGHLGSNAPSFLVLFSTLLYFYREIGYRVFLWIYILSGVIVWCIGRDSWHIGASGLVYGMASFLFFSGVIRQSVQLMAISLMVIFLYGSMIWGIFPLSPKLPYSWEAHLGGSIIGVALSFIYRHLGPQRVVKVWDETDDEVDQDNVGDEEVELEKDSDE